MSAFFVSAVLIHLLLFKTIVFAATTLQPCENIDGSAVTETTTITYVYDGDTVKLRDGRKLRLIGINTPEMGSKDRAAEAYAKQATSYLRRLLKTSNKVRIKYGRQKKDHYGRTLAHIFLEDGRNLNALMLKNGFARALHVPPNEWQFRCYDQLDKQAQKLKTGLWSNAYYQAVNVNNIIPKNNYESRFMIISGKVSRVNESKNTIWINLGSQFAIRIKKSTLSSFENLNFKNLVGKKLIARGYVVYYPKQVQFRMLVRHPVATNINEL